MLSCALAFGCEPGELREMLEAARRDPEAARQCFEAMAEDLGLLERPGRGRAAHPGCVFLRAEHEPLGLAFELAIPKNPKRPGWELYDGGLMRIRGAGPGAG